MKASPIVTFAILLFNAYIVHSILVQSQQHFPRSSDELSNSTRSLERVISPRANIGSPTNLVANLIQRTLAIEGINIYARPGGNLLVNLAIRLDHKLEAEGLNPEWQGGDFFQGFDIQGTLILERDADDEGDPEEEVHAILLWTPYAASGDTFQKYCFRLGAMADWFWQPEVGNRYPGYSAYVFGIALGRQIHETAGPGSTLQAAFDEFNASCTTFHNWHIPALKARHHPGGYVLSWASFYPPSSSMRLRNS